MTERKPRDEPRAGIPPHPPPSSDPQVKPTHPEPQTHEDDESGPKEAERQFKESLTKLPPD